MVQQSLGVSVPLGFVLSASSMDTEWKDISDTTARRELKGFTLQVMTRRKYGTSPSLVFWEMRRRAQILLYGNTKNVDDSKRAAEKAAEEQWSKEHGQDNTTDRE